MVLGDFSCRILLNLCGYVWPAYQCFKAIEQGQNDAVRDWCIYWFMLALFTIAERLLDIFAWWLPMYYTAKVAFVIYLWHPKTQGAISLYTHTVQPLLRQNEALIDQYFEGGKAWAFDALASNFRWLVSSLQSKATMAIVQLQQLKGQGSEAAQSADQGWPSAQQAVQAAVNALKPQNPSSSAKAD